MNAFRTPEIVYTLTFKRMMTSWSVIDSFRQVGLAGMPHAERIVRAERAEWVQNLSSTGRLTGMFVEDMSSEDLEAYAATLTNVTMQQANYSVDAASLVFAHSVLDDALRSFIEVSMKMCPEFWERRIAKKKFDMEAIKCRGYSELFDDCLTDELQRVEHNTSLPEKARLLFAVCKPGPESSFPRYQYDEAKLVQIDGLRREVIHGEGLHKQLNEISDVDEKLTFLKATGLYFVLVLNKALGLRLITDLLKDLPRSIPF